MSRYFISLVLISFMLINIQSDAQNLINPVTISPILGDKIDRVERDYFNLFPQFNGFQEAKYYLNTDSTVSVYIIYKDSGVSKDTLMYMAENLKTLIDYTNDIVRDKIKNDGGSEVNLIFNDGFETETRLFYANEKYIFTLNQTGNSYQNLPQKSHSLAFNKVLVNNIYKVQSIKSATIGNYMFYGLLLGLGAGILAGFVYTASNEEDYQGELGGIGQMGDLIVSASIGMAVGTLTGLIIGLVSQEDIITIYPNSPGGLAELREYVLNSK